VFNREEVELYEVLGAACDYLSRKGSKTNCYNILFMGFINAVFYITVSFIFLEAEKACSQGKTFLSQHHKAFSPAKVL